MENKVIKDHYMQGSGWVRLFFRKQGTPYEMGYKARYETLTQARDVYIIQFEGKPSFDSGYSAHEFDTLEEALACWDGLVGT